MADRDAISHFRKQCEYAQDKRQAFQPVRHSSRGIALRPASSRIARRKLVLPAAQIGNGAASFNCEAMRLRSMRSRPGEAMSTIAGLKSRRLREVRGKLARRFRSQINHQSFCL